MPPSRILLGDLARKGDRETEVVLKVRELGRSDNMECSLIVRELVTR